MRDIDALYTKWLNSVKDAELLAELNGMDGKAKADSFYSDLDFGTGGMRGILGAGTNKLNVYTVGKIGIGLSDYLLKNNGKSIAISYDSRIKSDLFARLSAGVFASKGLTVYLASTLMPTPFLSFMVRYYGCDAGVMITASHNPKEYNGYKVYGSDGCQVTDETAMEIKRHIDGVDCFDVDIDGAFSATEGIHLTDDTVKRRYLDCVYSRTVSGDGEVSVTYSALNGTGITLVPDILNRLGARVYYVNEQCVPDGHFPTCPYPNPEKREALALGLKYAESNSTDLLIATDPDADRIGVAVRHEGEYKLLSGNEFGILLTDYLLQTAPTRKGKPYVVVKTIVTSNLVKKITDYYGAELRDVFTGFKYIGEQIALLEADNEADRFLVGFEESYGYLSGTYVRDKDAVVASMLAVEMARHYQKLKKTLIDRLNEIYGKFGFTENRLISYRFEGSDGAARLAKVLREIHANKPCEIADSKVIGCIDYLYDQTGMRKSDVLKFETENGAELILRPSGTEPLVKAYLTACGKREDNARVFDGIKSFLDKTFG